MDHNFEHLPLPLVLSGKPKLRGGVHPSNRTNQNRANRTIHGGNLKRRSSELSQFWKERQQSRADAHLPHFEIGIPILLEIDPNSDLSFLKGLGFEIISENPSGYIIVATEDVDMSILNQKVDNFGAVITTLNFAQILCMFLSVSAQYRSFYRLICSSRRFLAHILSAQVEN